MSDSFALTQKLLDDLYSNHLTKKLIPELLTELN